MAGYCGKKMSINAVKAYENGEMPISKWTKEKIITSIEKKVQDGEMVLNCSLARLKRLPLDLLKLFCIYRTSWHHTGSYFRCTDFYSLDISAIEKLTDEELWEAYLHYREDRKKCREEKEKIEDEIWECGFLEWKGSPDNRVAIPFTEIGTISGNWFIRANGSKKRTNAYGFRRIRKVS